MNKNRPSFAIKTELRDLEANSYAFPAQKTMYGGKGAVAGDVIFLFSSENEEGIGLFARGFVISSEDVPRNVGKIRQTPRISITVKRIATTNKHLGRAELRKFNSWDDGAPETELNFKLYRQATNKIVGLSDKAADFLNGLF